MPTYEYHCPKCHKNFELFQNITAQPLKRCPTCAGKVKRLIGSGAGIIFKGSGFYQTDYRSAHYRKREREDKNNSSSAAASKSKSAGAKE
ncbi:MAG: zinc ribbon domain-containing protein [Lentisphaerae bacterium]|nr:zinc ribbon domain-containing protein [Lentisphaerota bacterium]